MQVSEQNLGRFSFRIIQELEKSEHYLNLRRSRTRKGSISVLDYLAYRNEPVRRCDLKKEFVSRRLNPEKMSDHELTRILNGLVKADFVERHEEVPDSKRTPERSKADVYYGVSPSRIKISDMMSGEDYVTWKAIEDSGCLIINTEGLRFRLSKEELTEIDMKNISDAELDDFFHKVSILYAEDRIGTVWRWANKLPEDEEHLRMHIWNWFERNERRFENGMLSPI